MSPEPIFRFQNSEFITVLVFPLRIMVWDNQHPVVQERWNISLIMLHCEPHIILQLFKLIFAVSSTVQMVTSLVVTMRRETYHSWTDKYTLRENSPATPTTLWLRCLLSAAWQQNWRINKNKGKSRRSFESMTTNPSAVRRRIRGICSRSREWKKSQEGPSVT